MSSPKPITITFIEDDSEDAFLVNKLLSGVSWQGATFMTDHHTTLGEALQAMAAKPPDIVLTDLFLPDSRAIDAIQNILKLYPDMPIVVLTGHDDDDTAREALKLGAQDYLVKGKFDGKLLARVLGYAIDRATHRREIRRLASFPELNPSPVLEYDLILEQITYQNPAAQLTFPDINNNLDGHALLQGLPFIIKTLSRLGNSFVRNISVGEKIYQEQFSQLADMPRLRIYLLDITERKKIDKLKDHFLQTVTHDLKMPLSIIKGVIENLTGEIEGPLTPNQHKLTNIALNHVERLETFISGILELSRLVAASNHVPLAPASLGHLVSEVVASRQTSAHSRGLTLTLQECGEILIPVNATLISQVVTNILDNALRHAKTEITLNMSQTTTAAIITVTDDGPSISDALHEHLFDGFQSGFGLAICKAILESHHGLLSYQRSAGRSVFQVQLQLS